MRKLTYYLSLMVLAGAFLSACQSEETITEDQISPEVLSRLVDLGFDIERQAPIRFNGGFLVEGDIFLTEFDLDHMSAGIRVPVEEQYSTNNLVTTSGSRTITVYMEVETSDGGGDGGNGGGPPSGKGPNKTSSAAFPSTYDLALDEAIARFNTENLELTFSRATSTSADIVITRLNKRDENRGVLGSAGFPTDSGDPYGEIKMSGVLETNYGLTVNGIATIMAHEMGHCIGFRHTDYFDRSISCGGSAYNEGDAGVGANHIPNTPTGATLADQYWMLSFTDGSDRPFNNDDKTALDYLY